MAELALRDQKGFTLIELLAVMAIVAVLAGIISISVAGTGQTSRDTQSRQDATSVESALASYFGSRDDAEVLTFKVATVLGRIEVRQVISTSWPENFISDAYPKVFPEGEISTVGSVTFLDSDGTLSDLTARGLLQGFNAIDFDVLFDDGFLTTVPKNVSEFSQDFSNYLWLLEKTTTAGGTGKVASREVAVFKLTSVDEISDSDLVDITYRLLFGGDFSDQHPVASSQIETTNEDTSLIINLEGADFESCELTFLIETKPNHGDLTSIFDNLCDPGEPNTDSASVTYIPDPNFNGIDSFAYSVIDGNGDDIGTINVTINVVNDAPIVQQTLDDLEVDEDAPDTLIDVIAAFTDVDIATNDDILTFTVISSKPSLVIATIGPTTLGSILNLQYQPDQHGTAKITVRATDSSLVDFVEIPFDVTVISKNDTPSFNAGDNETVDEDSGARTVEKWATNIGAGADNEDQVLTFLLSTDDLFSVQPAVSSTGTLTYTPAPDANGEATITVELQDNGPGSLKSAPQSFKITVEAVNDPPSFNLVSPDPNQTVFEDSRIQSVSWATNISAGADNESSQESTLFFDVTVDANETGLFSDLPAVSKNGILTYTAAANANGEATVTVKLVDGGGKANGGEDTSLPTVFTIFVNPFQNGSFELDPRNANNWSVDSGNIDWLPNTYWLASDGIYSLDLNGSQAGEISQTFATVIGQDYIVLFDMSKNNVAPSTASMTVSTGLFTENYEFSTATTAGITGNMHWNEEYFSFTATDSSTTLTFKSTTTGASGPALDNVRVIGVIFSDNGQALGSSQSNDVSLGDLDGDGDFDAFVSNGTNANQPNKVWLNDGSGKLHRHRPNAGQQKEH